MNMNLVNCINQRSIQLKRSLKINLDFALDKMCVDREFTFIDQIEDGAPPLASSLSGDVLSVANESGAVTLFNKHKLSPLKNWHAHNNAIFDIKWRFGCDNQLATASGDQSIILWDVNNGTMIHHFDKAHKGSIKSIHFDDNNMFSSGARDGVIKIWDLRCCEGGAVMVIEDAHLSRLPSVKPSLKTKPLRSSPLNSVTCVIYHPLTHQLYSSGANDQTIKIWDMRKCRRYSKTNNGHSTPVRQFNYSGKTSATPAHGFTSLAFDHNYRLYACCTDSKIYGYENGNSTSAVVKYTGHKVNNFTRIKPFANDYLVSGSVNGNAFIWPINESRESNGYTQTIWPLTVLPHDQDEVTAVECDNQWMSVYTCSDDQKITKWSMLSSNDNSQKVSAQKFQRPNDDIELIDIVRQKRPFSSSPPNSAPLTSIFNWLGTATKRNELTPHNCGTKRTRLTQSLTPSVRHSKENKDKNKTSKRKLFNNNKKISDYFN